MNANTQNLKQFNRFTPLLIEQEDGLYEFCPNCGQMIYRPLDDGPCQACCDKEE